MREYVDAYIAGCEARSDEFDGRPAVLLLEDDHDLRPFCAEVLREAGLEVVECATLTAALVAVRDRVPDILLLDGALADGDGLDLARWVRGRPALRAVRVIGFSARTSAQDLAAAAVAGCDAFVGKPCTSATLLAAIADAWAARAPRERRSAVVDAA